MVVGAKVCDLTEDLLRFVCGLYVGILTSSLTLVRSWITPVFMTVPVHKTHFQDNMHKLSKGIWTK